SLRSAGTTAEEVRSLECSNGPLHRSSPRMRGPTLPPATLTPGPPLARGRTEKTDSIVKQPRFVGPRFGRAWGLPVSFSIPPNVRGCGAPEQTPEEDTRLSSAPPAFPAFAFHGARTRAGPIVADGVAPGSARGCSCEPHPQVPVPIPPSRRLMKAPLDGRDANNLR